MPLLRLTLLGGFQARNQAGEVLSVPEIARHRGISLPAAKKLVLRATQQVRKRLEAIEGQEFCPEMRALARSSLFEKGASGLASEAGIARANISICAYSVVCPNIFATCSCTGVRPWSLRFTTSANLRST